MNTTPSPNTPTAPPPDLALHLVVRADPWETLRQHTAARIALGRVGASLPTAEVLRLGLAHAQARDAVHTPLDFAALSLTLQADGWLPLQVRSQALTRQNYLLRPDLGRRLHPDDTNRLRQHAGPNPMCELAIVVADGLSSAAVQQHAAPLLATLKDQLQTDWGATPLVLAEQGRVAIGDDIGELLGARLLVLLIGERPGLSSPASLGIYITYSPRIGRMDSERNCISNVRPEGLPYDQAAHKLAWLCRAALRIGVTGVALKDDSPSASIALGAAITLPR
ncbi:MAG: ethanolamine ammonia-lyase [Rhodoferax ferrireducens]|uniref:Ethanolamine ammonia-lyase small subunit n=1 Tax=Rhodoferax ferrireducens TaxID=192843 RepID=A0A1W9KSR8_9BURK|nr:MAG: ethanolamine ammonia-lyase [Rhodoferax ferrireducens]